MDTNISNGLQSVRSPKRVGAQASGARVPIRGIGKEVLAAAWLAWRAHEGAGAPHAGPSTGHGL